MGADDAAHAANAGDTFEWGPDQLVATLRSELDRHGLSGVDAAECARRLANASGPATKASLFVDLGALNFLAGDVAGAIATWRQAAASGQSAPATRAVFNLGLLHEELGLTKRAVELFTQVQTQGTEPHASSAILAKARAQGRGGAPQAAIETLAATVDSLLSERPNDPLVGRALLGIGEIASRADSPDRAEQAYRAASTSPDERVAQFAGQRLVHMLRVNGRTDEAQELIARLELDDRSPDLALERIESLLALGDDAGAQALIDRCDRRNYGPSQSFRFIDILERSDRVNEAIDELEMLLQSPIPEVESRAAVRLGRIYAANDMADAAQAMFESVADSDVAYWSDRASLLLGDLDHETGNPKDAARHWAQAAASGVESIAGGARERLVDAIDASHRILEPSAPHADPDSPSEPGQTATRASLGAAATAPPVDKVGGGASQLTPPVDSPASTEPTVIVLSKADRVPVLTTPAVIDLTAHTSGAPGGEPNPYAELAPPPVNGDIAPSARNPYAELAPDYPVANGAGANGSASSQP